MESTNAYGFGAFERSELKTYCLFLIMYKLFYTDNNGLCCIISDGLYLEKSTARYKRFDFLQKLNTITKRVIEEDF